MLSKMNPEVKGQWVRALRSGEREQGKGYLNQEGKFCCIGVLCELAVEAGVPVRKEAAMIADTVRYDGEVSGLPDKVAAWSGGVSTLGFIPQGWPTLRGHQSLAFANDSGVPFTEIADWIEENL